MSKVDLDKVRLYDDKDVYFCDNCGEPIQFYQPLGSVVWHPIEPEGTSLKDRHICNEFTDIGEHNERT